MPRTAQAVTESTLRTRVEHVMGMPMEITAPEIAAFDAPFAELRRADEVFSTYEPDSPISRLARGEIALADCPAEVDEVLTRCAELRERTDGFFSVRAGGALDPSGYVKGWAVERAAARLIEGGAADFLVNAAGDVLAAGAPPGADEWRVGIRHPVEHDALAAVVGARDLAVATSGQYERGEHVLDPHTGRAPTGLLSVTVAGPSLADADAYATAIFAMGAAGPKWSLGLDGYETLCVTAGGRVLTTPGMAALRR